MQKHGYSALILLVVAACSSSNDMIEAHVKSLKDAGPQAAMIVTNLLRQGGDVADDWFSCSTPGQATPIVIVGRHGEITSGATIKPEAGGKPGFAVTAGYSESDFKGSECVQLTTEHVRASIKR